MKLNSRPTIYWSLLSFKDWKFYIAATEKGLAFVGSLNKPFEELSTWVEKYFLGSPLIEDAKKLQPYINEMIEFLDGKRKTFTVPFDYSGTDFQLAVWNALCQIPYGQTKSYSDIATYINKPNAVRAVGTAIGANPILITVPCHRVIGKNGAITGYRGGVKMKKQLLELESHVLRSRTFH
ncbi:methylated-DNA--[protein]-cysteine S-methyltransferase [Niallia sp. Krafla_26]|uniref:methylated-DNA--[protein]-cysteine S-methyltransferase n=1 Tax=Niallia sp. Krafla_26 TaxID=3064703 RepID=UPI003D167516